MTTTTELPAPFTAYACDRLRKLSARRAKLIKEEADLVNARKGLEEELRGLGESETNRKRELADEYWDTICRIRKARRDIRWLADQIDKSIQEGDQLELIPGLNDIVEPPEDDESPKPSAGGGRRGKKKADAVDPSDDRPVGEPAPASSPRPGPDLQLARPAPEPWHDIDVGNIGLPERVAQALRNAELPSLGAVDARDFRLTTVSGVSPKDEAHIEVVVDALKEGKTREEAVEEAERAAALTPTSGKSKRSRKA